MRWIYLCPHPDDAALCAGGLIFDQAQRGQQVEIWTLMAGVPEGEELSEFARQMHAKWGTASARQTIELRRAEDRQAASVLGAEPVHFDFLDAIYRRGADGQPLYGEPVGAPVSPGDASLAAQISREVRERLSPDDKVICLMGIGGHVDHVLVRKAAELLGRALLYVADFPYVLNHPETVPAATAGLRSSPQQVSEAGLSAWVEAVESYRSQLSTVFGDTEAEAAIRAYHASAGGVQFWSLPGGGALDSGQNP